MLSEKHRPLDQPDKVIDVKTCECQHYEHISVGVCSGSMDFTLLHGNVSSLLFKVHIYHPVQHLFILSGDAEHLE